MAKTVVAGAGTEIFHKLEPKTYKNRPAPQHWEEAIEMWLS
jgi:hypothetical protein